MKNDFDVDCSGYCVDITNEKSVIENCKKIVKKYGRIDCLINNAANNPKIESSSKTNFSRLENFPVDLWNIDLDVSLKGTFLCIKHYENQISKNKNGG